VSRQSTSILETLPEPRLKVDKERGWLLESDSRIISFRVKTFQAFIDRLAAMAGSQVAATVLYGMGTEIGHNVFLYAKDRIKSDDDLGRVADEVMATNGWGRCLQMTKRSGEGKTVYTFTLSGTPFSHERESGEPTCHILRGALAGGVGSFVDKKAKACVEKECASMGASHCVIEVAFE
jgi:predicted hydrocarbon binding protein